jgi:hypothetical protein
LAENPPGLRLDPDQLADHGDGQQVGKVMHELDGAAIGGAISHGVEQIVGHLGNRGLERCAGQ